MKKTPNFDTLEKRKVSTVHDTCFHLEYRVTTYMNEKKRKKERVMSHTFTYAVSHQPTRPIPYSFTCKSPTSPVTQLTPVIKQIHEYGIGGAGRHN